MIYHLMMNKPGANWWATAAIFQTEAGAKAFAAEKFGELEWVEQRPDFWRATDRRGWLIDVQGEAIWP